MIKAATVFIAISASFLVFKTAPAMSEPGGSTLFVCHGYGCTFRSKLDLGRQDVRRFAAIMAEGRSSPKAERAAVARAVSYFERRSQQVTGIRDKPKSEFGKSRIRGQMDCIDESTNTRSLLLYLQRNRLLRHHRVAANASRGLFLDGRYPHSTAVLEQKAGGRWAVDSWYGQMGAKPTILPLEEWRSRGFPSIGES